MTDSSSSTLIERAARRLGNLTSPPTSMETQSPAPPPPSVSPAGSSVDQPARMRNEAPVGGQQRIDLDFRRLESLGVFSPDIRTNRTTEEIRLVKRSVLSNVAMAAGSGTRNHNLVMVTSSRQGEGKSFVAFNLALSLASETDKTVLLVDADSSRSSVERILGVEAKKGFLDLLEDESLAFSDVLIRTGMERLAILPAGDPHLLSTELFAGSRATSLLQEMSQRYEDRIVIFDSPPILATSEPTALALHIGQIVFVVDAQQSSKATVREALNLISACSNIGFVLNKAEFEFGTSRFGNYNDYYGYSRTRSGRTRRSRRDRRKA